MSLADVFGGIFGRDLPVRIECYDGSAIGPEGAPASVVIGSPRVLQRVATAPGELGFARAYVAGELDVRGDLLFALAELRRRVEQVRLTPQQWLTVLKAVGPAAIRPLPPPPQEVGLRGRRHSKARDAAAISHHYDVSNAFYRSILGPSMTYSCAVWPSADATLEQAQEAKYELISRKLGLKEGMRLLDVGCGWGGMAMHAAIHHGVHAVGVTISRRQAEWAEKAVADAGLSDRVEIRVQDYRDVRDGPYDAISSIGMFEHVGLAQLGTYFDRLYALLRPEGRLLNHGISRPPSGRARFARRSFIDRYVFPDGELLEVGSVVSAIQRSRFEVRHVEGLREHYGLTLRAWVANLERHWDEAVAEAGLARARIWRLYMAGAALNFEAGRTQIHQVLAVKAPRGGAGLPLRPDW
jgi:cyclopropane-fatty-acyl-phospholipid synthase